MKYDEILIIYFFYLSTHSVKISLEEFEVFVVFKKRSIFTFKFKKKIASHPHSLTRLVKYPVLAFYGCLSDSFKSKNPMEQKRRTKKATAV